MCEYINHLNKFKKYKYPCKRKTKEILESEDSFLLLLKCLGLNTLDVTTVYIFYRTDDSINNTIKLDDKKEKKNIKRLKDLKNSIIDGSEGYLEVYVFDNENINDQNHFDKLYRLINEFCDVDKINTDYDSTFIHNFKKLSESFLLLSYDIIKKYSFVIIGLLFTGLVISIYTVLINHGYPYELIDHGSIIFLTKFYLSYLGWMMLIFICLIVIIAFWNKYKETNRQGEKNYKITFVLSFFLLVIAMVYSIKQVYTNETLLQNYHQIHIFPRLIQDQNITSLAIYKKGKTIYSYKLDELMNKKTIQEVCKPSDTNDTNAISLMSSIMYKTSTFKNINITDMSNKIIFLDENSTKKLILTKYCHK